MPRLDAALALILATATPLAAQDAYFQSYDAMRGEMDAMIMARETQALMLRFGGADEMTEVQLDNLDVQVDQLYPNRLDNVALIRRVEHDNGFVQELIAYWEDWRYLYAYVFYHVRDDAVISINFRFNSDFAKLNPLF